MEIGHIIPHIEALVFASDKPLTAIDITELVNNAFGFMEDKITIDQVQTAMEGIVEKYTSEFYPFEMKESGGGWQFLTKKDYHKTIAQLNGDKYLKRLSAAALETLAIIAYKQPITKSEIEGIRGVSCDYSIQKLLEKELIVISGRNEDLPGKPLIYNTSRTFMDYFGINSPDDLPKLKEIFNDALVDPTTVTPSGANGMEGTDVNESPGGQRSDEQEEETIDLRSLVVTQDGELQEEKDGEHHDEPEDQAAENQDNEPENAVRNDGPGDQESENYNAGPADQADADPDGEPEDQNDEGRDSGPDDQKDEN